MNKAELVSAMAETSEVSQATAGRCLDAMIESVTKALKSGDEVSLVGFGSFKVTKREARTGRNPRTGEPIQIDAANVPKFSAGKVLKDSVN